MFCARSIATIARGFVCNPKTACLTGNRLLMPLAWSRKLLLKMFKAECSDGSKWDVVIMKKRTGLFPKGDWTHQSAAAAAYPETEHCHCHTVK